MLPKKHWQPSLRDLLAPKNMEVRLEKINRSSFADLLGQMNSFNGLKTDLFLVGSKEAIMPRSSHLDPDVQVSLHLAPDVLSLRFCSCGDNHGRFRELQCRLFFFQLLWFPST